MKNDFYVRVFLRKSEKKFEFIENMVSHTHQNYALRFSLDPKRPSSFDLPSLTVHFYCHQLRFFGKFQEHPLSPAVQF